MDLTGQWETKFALQHGIAIMRVYIWVASLACDHASLLL